VWINKGEIMEHDPYAHERRMTEQGDTRSRGADRGGRDRRPARAN
jgi:small subunit ribosomal protein S3